MTESKPEVLKGSCLCRGVRFEATPPSGFCAHCHCNNCRRAHGAAFVTWIGFKTEQLRITDGEPLVTRYSTDTAATRMFCSRCGSTLFYEGPRWPGKIDVVLANLDGPADRRPTGHVYVDHRASWWKIEDDLPQYGGPTGTEKKEPG